MAGVINNNHSTGLGGLKLGTAEGNDTSKDNSGFQNLILPLEITVVVEELGSQICSQRQQFTEINNNSSDNEPSTSCNNSHLIISKVTTNIENVAKTVTVLASQIETQAKSCERARNAIQVELLHVEMSYQSMDFVSESVSQKTEFEEPLKYFFQLVKNFRERLNSLWREIHKAESILMDLFSWRCFDFNIEDDDQPNQLYKTLEATRKAVLIMAAKVKHYQEQVVRETEIHEVIISKMTKPSSKSPFAFMDSVTVRNFHAPTVSETLMRTNKLTTTTGAVSISGPGPGPFPVPVPVPGSSSDFGTFHSGHFISAPVSIHSYTETITSVPAVQIITAANSSFSAALHCLLSGKNPSPSNLIFSSYSLNSVIAMAKLGARGRTGEEIRNTLHFPQDDQVLLEGFSQIIRVLQEASDHKGCILSMANRMYTQVGFQLNPEFSNHVQNAFGAEVKQVNFENNVGAAKEINTWVEYVTQSKIKDLIDPSVLNSLTRIVLVNGVYFKGLWKHQFDPKITRKDMFYTGEYGGNVVQVDMMYKAMQFSHANVPELDAQVVALDYQGGRLCMLIYLPNVRTGLRKVEEGLKNTSIKHIFWMMQKREVAVHLPRFRIESTLSLVEPLEKLGIKTMFLEDEADFSGIPQSPIPLFVSHVIQKAFIDVNEEGTEAAAASGFGMLMTFGSSQPPPPILFKVDHPFAFQIVDCSTKFVLFAGSCTKPVN